MIKYTGQDTTYEVFLENGKKTIAQIQGMSKSLDKLDLQTVKLHLEYLVKKKVVKENKGLLSIS